MCINSSSNESDDDPSLFDGMCIESLSEGGISSSLLSFAIASCSKTVELNGVGGAY